MENKIRVSQFMDSIVPITRFNKGEANHIFEEVVESGTKIVLKNNVPACVLVEPKHYDAMLEALEDYALYVEACKRSEENEELFSADEVLKILGIDKTEIDTAEEDE